MTVREKLRKLMGRNIKIGCNDGGSFIFCGPVTEGLFEWLDRQSDLMKRTIDQGLEKAMYNAEHFENEYFPKYISMVDCKRLKDGLPILNEEEREHVHNYMKTEICVKRVNRWKNSESKFHPTLNAEVLQTYNSILPEEQGTIIVIFEGCYPSNHTFWTIEECRNSKVPEEIERIDRILGVKAV
jgi:hypothetical protein